ncbi:hypothetical protein EV363DRAFT_1445760 [Boletus edulis]|nr:hypothetical protein EV363DRAFT_1445760 [Boletus edulis]
MSAQRLRGTVVNRFSEKLEFLVRERPSAAPIPDPIELVLTLRANMRGADGLSPSVGDSGCHAFNRIGSNGDFQAIRGLQSKHEAVCCFEEGFGAEMASIAKATVVIPQRFSARCRSKGRAASPIRLHRVPLQYEPSR